MTTRNPADDPGDPFVPGCVPLRLTGTDGNAFSIMGRAVAALRKNGYADQIKPYQAEAMSGDYDNLLQVTMRWFDVS